MRPALTLLAALILLADASAECSGEASMNVPAVVGDGGGLVNMSMKLVPGTGKVFIGVLPRTGMDTQESVEDAVAFARSAGADDSQECDILLTFSETGAGKYVEGPSAGVAMAVIAYALLGGHTMREDAIMTGSVSPEGRIGSVGGLEEKAKAAAAHGADYFITPPRTIYEMLVLERMEGAYGITILEAQDADDVIGFMLFNRSINQTDFRADELEPPNISAYAGSGVGEFGPVAWDMVRLTNSTLQGLVPEDEESEEVRKFFAGRLGINAGMLEKGYLFTAANSAFLDYIEISTIIAILGGDVDTAGRREEAEACLASVAGPRMTDENFQWMVGAELREAWALDKLNQTSEEAPMLNEERYATYHELMYADAWCRVAQSLEAAAGEGGVPIDQGIWKPLADEMLAMAGKGVHSADTEDRLRIARESYARGRYGAAIYDGVFVIEMDAADAELGEADDEAVAEAASELASQERTSLWGRVYQTQGAFLAGGDSPDYGTAYRILRLAKGLDSATELMRVQVELNKGSEDSKESGNPFVLFLQLSIFLIFAVLLAYITMHRNSKGRSHGDKPKAHRGADRAEQA